MDRLKAIGSFAAVVVVVVFLLRLLHVAIPAFYPKVLMGPFSLDSIEAAPEYLGFSPRMPFYRPEQLGVHPVHITVTRRPYPKIVVFWQAEHYLYLAEQQGGPAPRAGADDAPMPGRPEGTWSRDGRAVQVVLRRDDLWVEVRTDLSVQDVQRIVDSLTPYEQLR